MTHNWPQLALTKLGGPNNPQVHGNGRWALRNERGDIYLYETEHQAVASQPFANSRVWDLEPVNFDKIPDLTDADERRKLRREQQSRAQ
jgi:hypothetical protein